MNDMLQIRCVKFLVFTFIFIQSFGLQAQNTSYARMIVDTLCSEAFYGRGYVNQGDRKAAEFIVEQFGKHSIEPVGASFLQEFSFSVNTQPDKLVLKLNREELLPGRDFLVDPASPSFSGHYNGVSVSLEDLLNEQVLMNKLKEAADEFLIIEPYDQKNLDKATLQKLNDLLSFLKYHPNSPLAGVIILTNDKLTWHGSTLQLPRPVLTVRTEAVELPVEKVHLKVDSEFDENYTSQNVIGFLPGKSDSIIVLTAHYDHLGMMGEETMFPGANDNASGVALMLDMARYFSSQNDRKYSMAFIAFSGEELGLLGSKYFTEHPLFALNKIKFLLNFDISGTGDEGIQVVNGSVFKSQFDRLQKLNSQKKLLAKVKVRGEACNSDHCMFYRKQVPCFFIYTLGGIQAYHDIYDKAETLPLTAYESYFKLMKNFVEGF